MKKILYYNWVQFDDKLYSGGGVSIYQYNLIKELLKNNDYIVYFLSSGKTYDRNTHNAYIKETVNCFGDRCRSFHVVNSPVLASAKLSFFDIRTYLEDLELKRIFTGFLKEYGEFDVVHFNNFEGLTLHTLEVKEQFPYTKFIYSLHNYYLFCPEVQLWQHDSINCKDYCDGRECVHCISDDVWKWKVKRKHYLNRHRDGLSYNLQSRLLDSADRIRAKLHKKMSAEKENEYAKLFSTFRKMNIEFFNRYIDKLLCVSQAVFRIAIKMGLNENKCTIQYIGTEYSTQLKAGKVYDESIKYITIVYLGYANVYKGFNFMLESLENMTEEIAQRINIIICARNIDVAARKRIDRLVEKFHSISVSNGYSHEQLPDILKDADLGIVPVLWEDNLPQTAIEFTVYGVPVLSSDLGGAGELSRESEFCFEAGNHQQFNKRLEMFLNHPQKLMDYWNSYRGLISMEQHTAELKKYYEGND